MGCKIGNETKKHKRCIQQVSITSLGGKRIGVDAMGKVYAKWFGAINKWKEIQENKSSDSINPSDKEEEKENEDVTEQSNDESCQNQDLKEKEQDNSVDIQQVQNIAIEGWFNTLLRSRALGIKLVNVFDGGRPNAKMVEIRKRLAQNKRSQEIRDELEGHIIEDKKSLDAIKDKIIKAQQYQKKQTVSTTTSIDSSDDTIAISPVQDNVIIPTTSASDSSQTLKIHIQKDSDVIQPKPTLDSDVIQEGAHIPTVQNDEVLTLDDIEELQKQYKLQMIKIADGEKELITRQQKSTKFPETFIPAMKRCSRVLRIPTIDAPEEADDYLAALYHSGHIDGVDAMDFDYWAHGVDTTYRNLDKDTNVLKYCAKTFLSDMKLESYDELTTLYCLTGCDYVQDENGLMGVKNCGPVTAVKWIRKFKNDLDKIYNFIITDPKNKRFIPCDNFLELSKVAKSIFNLRVKDQPQPSAQSLVDPEEVKQFLLDFGWYNTDKDEESRNAKIDIFVKSVVEYCNTSKNNEQDSSLLSSSSSTASSSSSSSLFTQTASPVPYSSEQPQTNEIQLQQMEMEGIEEQDINCLMSQAKCTREEAIKILINNKTNNEH